MQFISSDAVNDELLSPPGLGPKLVSCGLVPVDLTIEEFFLAEEFGARYKRLSVYDRIALAIAKERHIVLLTGDNALRKAAGHEAVEVIGTLWILDELQRLECVSAAELSACLKSLLYHNGGAVRLPENELRSRLDALGG